MEEEHEEEEVVEEEEEDAGFGVQRAAPAYGSSRRAMVNHDEEEVQEVYGRRAGGKSAAKSRGKVIRDEGEDDYEEAEAPPVSRRGDRAPQNQRSGGGRSGSSRRAQA